MKKPLLGLPPILQVLALGLLRPDVPSSRLRARVSLSCRPLPSLV